MTEEQVYIARKDLSNFKIINLDDLMKAGNEKRWKTEATIHYVIKDQKLFTKRLGTITDFKPRYKYDWTRLG